MSKIKNKKKKESVEIVSAVQHPESEEYSSKKRSKDSARKGGLKDFQKNK